jgi:7 transmembrane sweet-taste receptor of 3 GCPR
MISSSRQIMRINQIFEASKHFQRVHVTIRDVMVPFCIICSLNVTVLTVLTIGAPPRWVRNYTDDTHSFAYCNIRGNNLAMTCFCLLLIINFVAVILALKQIYNARNISTEYNEGVYITIAMASMLQAFLTCLPILALVQNSPPVSFFVKTSIIFVISMSLILLIFLPKQARKQQPRPSLFIGQSGVASLSVDSFGSAELVHSYMSQSPIKTPVSALSNHSTRTQTQSEEFAKGLVLAMSNHGIQHSSPARFGSPMRSYSYDSYGSGGSAQSSPQFRPLRRSTKAEMRRQLERKVSFEDDAPRDQNGPPLCSNPTAVMQTQERVRRRNGSFDENESVDSFASSGESPKPGANIFQYRVPFAKEDDVSSSEEEASMSSVEVMPDESSEDCSYESSEEEDEKPQGMFHSENLDNLLSSLEEGEKEPDIPNLLEGIAKDLPSIDTTAVPKNVQA